MPLTTNIGRRLIWVKKEMRKVIMEGGHAYIAESARLVSLSFREQG